MSSSALKCSSTDLIARGLDVGARGIDLLQTIAEISNSPNGAIQAASKLMYWLGREGVNSEDLECCLRGAKDLAHPNTAGAKFCSQVIEGIESMPHSILRPFKSISSGSLGRFLVLDPSLSWITSTITSLYQYHDEKFITYVVTALIVQMRAQKGDTRTKVRPTFWSDPECLRLMPVVQKMTSSIWLNIVNSGNASLSPPDELRTICPVGHHLNSKDLVEALVQINDPHRGPQIIITSRFMLGNLSLWLLYHFNGLLRVVVGGETVYESKQGHDKQEIELRIGTRCSSDGKCDDWRDGERQVEIVDCVAGNASQARKPLYSITSWHAISMRDLHAMESRVQKTALDLTRWLCSLRIEPFLTAPRIVYKVNLRRSGAGDKNQIFMTDLLKRSPAILQASWAPDLPRGWKAEEAVEIWSPEGFAEAKASRRQRPDLFDDTESAKATRQSLIQRCYPGLCDLIAKAHAECSCLSCTSQRATKLLQPGCLKLHAYASVLGLLAHSIADAFGAGDASGSDQTSFQSTNSDVFSVERVLLGIAQTSLITWQSWFEVASCVYLGRLCSDIEARHYGTHDLPASDSMTIAIQHGCIAVIAPWIDLSLDITPLGSFGFVTVQGRLCVTTTKQSSSDSGYQFLDTDFAIVKTRLTEATHFESHTVDLDTNPCNVHLEEDSNYVEVDAILFPSDREVHFLLTRERAGRFSRMIDPCAAAIMQAKHFHEMKAEVCKHDSEQPTQELANNMYESIVVDSFDRLLGSWPHGDPCNLHLSQVLDTYLKYNVALALTENAVVAINNSTCWKCSAHRLFEVQDTHSLGHKGIFMINIRHILKRSNECGNYTDLSKIRPRTKCSPLNFASN